MDVCLFRVLCVIRYSSQQRADHSFRGVLPTVLRCGVWAINLVNEETLAHWGAFAPKTKKQTISRISHTAHRIRSRYILMTYLFLQWKDCLWLPNATSWDLWLATDAFSGTAGLTWCLRLKDILICHIFASLKTKSYLTRINDAKTHWVLCCQ